MDNPNTTFAGAGTIVKKGVGALQWGAGAATFNLSTGSLIDVQGGTFVASSGANEVWSSNKSSLNIASGAAFQTVEGQIQVDALNGAGSLVLGTTSSSYTSKMTVGVQGGSGSFSGAISNITSFNNGTFYKVGAGTQSLTGANTYTGATTVSGGTLQIGNGSNSGTLGSGSVSVASGSNLNFYRSDSISIGNSISGAGSLNFSGTNSTINFGQSSYSLSGDNSSFSGIINITSSRLGVSNQKNVGLSSSIAVSNGGTLYLNATANNVTLTNNLSLGGVGWTDGSGLGNLGALRLQNSSGYSANYAGNISLTSSTRVGAYGATGIISGAITGASGSNLEINASSGGTVIFTSNNNTYSGTTTINSGTLQIGNAGTSGRLGSGNVVNNSSLVFNRDASSDLTVANAISGSGNVTQTGAGRTILSSNNYYLGSTTITNGTLQIGNGETAGTLGTGGAVTLSNGANINFVRNTSTSIDNDISGNGNINAIITGAGSDLTINSNISISGASGSQTNNAILSSAGSINQTAGKTIAAKNLYLTAINGGIGLSGQRINTSVDNLSLNSSSSQYVTENDAVTVAAKTTSNGNIDITTTNGTMSIGSINGISGITADGSGDVNLRASSSSSHGIFSNQTIKGRNITMVANATSTSVRSLGYYGAGGSMEASEKLNLTGTSASEGNGFYIYSGTYKAGSGITITGTSLNGQGLGIEKDAVITNTSGNIILTGSANVINSNAIGLKGSKITNNGGNIELKAINGNVITGKVNPVWFGGVDPNTADLTATNTISSNGTGTVQITAGNASAINSGAIDGSFLSISQSTNGGDVLISTSGVGNVTSPRINNAGIGNVVLAAGSAVAAGTGSGGQVKTVSGNTITQSGTGKTLIFTGTLADTDRLSNLDDNLTYLFASDVGANKRNLTANKAYASGYSIAGGAQAQVIFRQAIDLGTVDFTATVNKTYGDVGYTQSSLTVGANQLMSDLSSALAASDLNSINLSGGNATSAIKFNKSTLVKQMALISTDWVNPTNFSSTGYRNSSSGNFIVNTAGSDFTVVASGTETLAIAQAKLTEVTGSKTYDGQNFSVTSGTSNGSLTITGVNGETASLKSGESLAITSANAGTTAVTSNGISSLNNSKLSSGGNIDLSNYDLSQAPVSTNSVAIAQAKLTEVSGSKIYDSNTNLSNGLLSIKGVNGEEFTTDKSTITLGSKNVVGTDGNGANSVINIANLILTGKNSTTTELASNYDLTQGSAINTVQITQAKLTEVTGAKIYDGTSKIKSNEILSIKGINGEEFIAESGTANISDKNVLTASKVLTDLSSLILIGKNDKTIELASNYRLGSDLPSAGSNNNVYITPKGITSDVFLPAVKSYDGSTKASTSVDTSNQVVSTDDVKIKFDETSPTYDSAVIGTGKKVTISGVALNGNDASNYSIASTIETKKNTINAAAPVTPVRTPAVTTSSSKSSKSGAAGANPFQLASAEVDIEEENVCSTASAASCKCESSSTAPGVSICYSGN
jgi:autotransporter-associated beta strand protein